MKNLKLFVTILLLFAFSMNLVSCSRQQAGTSNVKSDVYIYFPLIISTLLNKMEKSLKKNSLRKISRSDNSIKSLSKNYQYTDTNLTILNKFFDVLDIMNDKYRKYFLLFLPQVINFFIATNLIENIEFRQKLKKYINHEKE